MSEFEKMGVAWKERDVVAYIEHQFPTLKNKINAINDLEILKKYDNLHCKAVEVNNLPIIIHSPEKFCNYWGMKESVEGTKYFESIFLMYYSVFKNKFKMNLQRNFFHKWLSEQNKTGNELLLKIMPEYELKKIFNEKIDDELIFLIKVKQKAFLDSFVDLGVTREIIIIQCDELQMKISEMIEGESEE